MCFFLRILNAPGSWFFHASLIGPISMRRSRTASMDQSEGFGRAVYFLVASKVLNEGEKNKVPSQRKRMSRTRAVCVFILKVLLAQTCLRLFVCLLTYLCLLLSAQICEQSLFLIGCQACFTWCVCVCVCVCVWYFCFDCRCNTLSCCCISCCRCRISDCIFAFDFVVTFRN